MICPNCQYPNAREANFCTSCGSPLPKESSRPSASQPLAAGDDKRTVLNDIATRINRVAGIDTPVELNLREVFSNVTVKHTEEEAERLFAAGTSETTPDISTIADTWPKPWLFARVFLIVAVAYFGLYLGVSQFENINLLPGLITLGSFMVPLTILIFFWEMNAPQNISMYQVMKMLLVGGVLSMIAAIFIFESLADSGSAIIIGIVEEAAKVLVLLLFLKERKYPYVLNGLLIGAAVGTGFAAFESAGYAFQVLIHRDLHAMYSTIFWRGVLAPGGHIVWAALSGAALCMVKGDQAFEWAMLKDSRFLRIFAIVVILHAVWDLPWGSFADLPLAQIVLTVVSWIIAFAVMNVGLKQISRNKQQPAQAISPSDGVTM
ncbi:PrsW family intramembrane metalloprotease [Cohnella pontilimi]|uniref:PrsW family intramembrane metalloprotease n=1 Tax=Cohnella pontilimi TaxID=2564100 RepID=A0A4U0FC43_9BACL|nr:PrsW family glutamic-type intramembrane protease [Cohnella pontilimi]TJY41784.1 PrsW family intramembrane metalloprotease [Cohnella pontilimi]